MIVEILLVLPFLLLFLFGLIQFYSLVTAREELLAASRLGARVAATGEIKNRKQVEAEVAKTVQRSLRHGRLRSAEVRVIWSQDLKAEEVGGEADWVMVRLSIPVRRAVPDLLGWAGYTFGREQIVAATTSKQE
jgi:hypothetical protein